MLVAVFFRILVWEMPLEGVRHELATGPQLLTPDVGLSFQSAALREFELGFGRLVMISSSLLYAFEAAAELNTATFDSQNRNLESTLEFPAQEQLHLLLA
jgi:hypothetical protein